MKKNMHKELQEVYTQQYLLEINYHFPIPKIFIYIRTYL